MATPGGFAPQRTPKSIIMYLTPTQPIPPAVPLELQEYIPLDVWTRRTTAAADTAFKYSKPTLEKIWMVLGVLSAIILPALFYNIVFRALINRDEGVNKFVLSVEEARGASFGVLVAVVLLFSLPVIVWKLLGRRQINRMLAQWSHGDIVMNGKNVPRPNWTVTLARLFQNTVTISISIPAHTTSLFHHNAYLPGYINPPVDSDAYFYPYQKGETGLPRMSVVGSVPLYMDEKRRSPLFSASRLSKV